MNAYSEEQVGEEKVSAAVDLREFKIGWRIIVLSLIGVATSASVMPLYGFGTMVLPLQEAFGWGRGELLATASFLSFGAVFSSQLAGWLNKAYGMRPVALVSLILLPLAFFLMSQIDLIGNSIWILYGCFLLATFAGIGTLQVTWTQLTNLWFEKNRGLALAMILSGSGIAALILPPMITMIVESWGWKGGFIFLAVVPLLITLPLAYFWLSPIPVSASKMARPDLPPLDIPGIPFAEGLRSVRYWTINVSMVLVSSAIIIMVINTVPLLRDKGFDAIDAGRMFSAFGVSLVAGRVLVGYLVDRLWAPGVSWVALSLPALGCLMLFMVENNTMYLIAGIMLVGVGAGAEFDIAAFLVARYFGMRDYSRLFGVQMGVISGGICLAPALAAWLYKITGSYDTILIINTVLFFIGAAILLTLGRYPRFPVASQQVVA